jgi:hypothetical protein
MKFLWIWLIVGHLLFCDSIVREIRYAIAELKNNKLPLTLANLTMGIKRRAEYNRCCWDYLFYVFLWPVLLLAIIFSLAYGAWRHCEHKRLKAKYSDNPLSK